MEKKRRDLPRSIRLLENGGHFPGTAEKNEKKNCPPAIESSDTSLLPRRKEGTSSIASFFTVLVAARFIRTVRLAGAMGTILENSQRSRLAATKRVSFEANSRRARRLFSFSFYLIPLSNPSRCQLWYTVVPIDPSKFASYIYLFIFFKFITNPCSPWNVPNSGR